MALKIELKPNERIIIGESVITNDGHRTKLTIEGHAPILRENDIMLPQEAKTPCENVYVLVQMMYLDKDPAKHHKMYFEMINDIIEAAPSTVPHIDKLNNQILTGSYYKALKETKALIAYEKELMNDA